MNFVTEEEIKKIFDKDDVEIVYNQKSGEIKISRSYEYFSLKFSHLEKLSKLLGTEEISVSKSDDVRTGCGTCGYGSCYSIVLTVPEIE
jgi:hypothetical protein